MDRRGTDYTRRHRPWPSRGHLSLSVQMVKRMMRQLVTVQRIRRSRTNEGHRMTSKIQASIESGQVTESHVTATDCDRN